MGGGQRRLSRSLGEVTIDRTYCRCPHCEGRTFPKDALLEVENTSFSPGVRRLMAKSGARDSFARAEEDLLEYAGICVDAKDVERVAEAIGAAIARQEQTRRVEALADDVFSPDEPIPVFSITCDGTGVPVNKRETVGRKGAMPKQEKQNRDASSPGQGRLQRDFHCGQRDRPRIRERLRRQNRSASVSMPRQ
jgi:hypothetical protein